MLTRISTIVFLVILLVSHRASGQGTAGEGAAYEPNFIIDLPTAGLQGHGIVSLDLDVYQEGGLLASTAIGAFDRLLLGVSFGGRQILGTGTPDWNPVPGFLLKIRVLDETVPLPAIAIGFTSQGHGDYIDSLDRYQSKSPGFFAVLSKNYRSMGFLAFHCGINYSLEGIDDNRTPDLFVGVEKTIGPVLSVMGTYSVGLHDNGAVSRGRGYLNAGAAIAVGGGLTISMHVKDILQNQQSASIGERTLRIEYIH